MSTNHDRISSIDEVIWALRSADEIFCMHNKQYNMRPDVYWEAQRNILLRMTYREYVEFVDRQLRTNLLFLKICQNRKTLVEIGYKFGKY